MLDISTDPVPAALVYPKNSATEPLVAQDLGPVALSDPSEGLNSYLWAVGYIEESDMVTIIRESQSGNPLFVIPDITFLDVTFDPSGAPVVSYQRNGSVWLYWFDPIAGEFTHTNLATGSEPFVHLDLREGQLGSEVILSYRTGSTVHYRLSSDRYTVEYTVPNLAVQQLTGAAMAINNRFLWRGLEDE